MELLQKVLAGQRVIVEDQTLRTLARMYIQSKAPGSAGPSPQS